MYAEDLVQINTTSTIATSVPLSPYNPYLVDFVGHDILPFSITLATMILPPPLLRDSPKLHLILMTMGLSLYLLWAIQYLVPCHSYNVVFGLTLMVWASS